MYRSIFLLSLAVPTVLAARNALVAVRQDQSKNGFVELFCGETGAVVGSSNLTFVFSWPYVQMTADVVAGTSYLTAYPDGFSYPALYVLDRDLEVTGRFEDGDFTWWDLQVAPRQNTLYGVMVTEDFNGGMYGRTLSNYSHSSAGDGYLELQAQQLYTLPYMWYVNASSIDQVQNTYFALVNNFPGHENSTTDQKLVVAEFSQAMETEDPTDEENAVRVLELDLGDVMAQFIAFSVHAGELFFSGPSKEAGEASVTVGVMCQEHGKVERVLYSADGVSLVGPLVTDDMNGRVLFFVQVESSHVWRLMSVGYEEGSVAEQVAEYPEDAYRSVAAAVHMLY